MQSLGLFMSLFFRLFMVTNLFCARSHKKIWILRVTCNMSKTTMVDNVINSRSGVNHPYIAKWGSHSQQCRPMLEDKPSNSYQKFSFGQLVFLGSTCKPGWQFTLLPAEDICGDPAYHCMCSMQVVDITPMKHRLTSITSIRVVQ
jgi:hypothetical protein